MILTETKPNPTLYTLVEPDLSFQHLQAELARIDSYIQREVLRWQLAGQDPLDAFRGLYLSDADADALLAQPLGTSWGQTVLLDPLEIEVFAEAETQAMEQTRHLVETARQQGQLLRLEHLANVFNLDRFERDALLICLAPSLDIRYEQLYGYLQDNLNRRRPTVNLVLNLLCEPGPERLLKLPYFVEDAPLHRYHLIQSTPEPRTQDPSPLAQVLTPDPTLLAWLLGDYRPRPELNRHIRLAWPQITETDRLLARETLPQLRQTINEQAILALYGPDRLRQEAAARLLAAETDQPLLIIDLAAMTNEDLSPLQVLRLAIRDARLTQAVPILFGWDSSLTSEGTIPTALLTELCRHPGLVIVAGQRRWQPVGLNRSRPLHRLEFPVPDFPQRQAIWTHFMGMPPPKSPLEGGTGDDLVIVKASPLEGGRLEGGPSLDIPALSGQFALTTGKIRDVIASARDAASERGSEMQNEDLFAAARSHSNPRLAELARQIEPRFGWADIILPADQLTMLGEVVATVRERPKVLDEWGVGQKLASSAGVTVLFAGPPGTGKTMAAEVIAAELGLDLYKIDLSNVVSKYIGETEKNLEKIFNEAQSSNAILFFDEADAIFGKRSEVKDAHDRYANIEVSYLLQRMEDYDGITILATNLRANLDEAFTRRLHFAIDFPFPEAEDRLRIYQALFPPEVPRVTELDFDHLARRFELAGGNIRNVIVSAAYLAAADGGRVTMEHLLHGTRRELQKMGRLVGEGELTISWGVKTEGNG